MVTRTLFNSSTQYQTRVECITNIAQVRDPQYRVKMARQRDIKTPKFRDGRASHANRAMYRFVYGRDRNLLISTYTSRILLN